MDILTSGHLVLRPLIRVFSKLWIPWLTFVQRFLFGKSRIQQKLPFALQTKRCLHWLSAVLSGCSPRDPPVSALQSEIWCLLFCCGWIIPTPAFRIQSKKWWHGVCDKIYNVNCFMERCLKTSCKRIFFKKLKQKTSNKEQQVSWITIVTILGCSFSDV